MENATPGIRLVREDWRGWSSLFLSSAQLHVRIVPDLGGRVMEYALGGHEFFWVNPHLDALSPVADSAKWMNWGGDKVWLAPQGWGGGDQWAGPPDPVLDAGRFDAEADTDGTSVTVSLTSRHDQRSGMQISRMLRFRAGTTRVEIVCTMTNLSDRSRRWGLWPVAQIDAASRRNGGMNAHLRACVPLRNDSAYESGYRVIYGDVANLQYRVTGGMLAENSQDASVSFMTRSAL